MNNTSDKNNKSFNSFSDINYLSFSLKKKFTVDKSTEGQSPNESQHAVKKRCDSYIPCKSRSMKPQTLEALYDVVNWYQV